MKWKSRAKLVKKWQAGFNKDGSAIGKALTLYRSYNITVYRWVQNVAGYELMLPDEELQNVADLDSAIDSILLL